MSATVVEKSNGLIKAILITGLIAGAMDITGAFLHAYFSGGRSPVFVLQYVASPVLGKESFEMGAASAMAGLLFHFFIATSWTTLFYLAYPKINFLSKNKVVVGLLYGIFVWTMMSFVVLKIAGISRPFEITLNLIIGMVIIMVCIGLPISIKAHQYYKTNN